MNSLTDNLCHASELSATALLRGANEERVESSRPVWTSESAILRPDTDRPSFKLSADRGDTEENNPTNKRKYHETNLAVHCSKLIGRGRLPGLGRRPRRS